MHKYRQPRILCPTCKKDQLTLESATDSEVHCADCSISFPVKDGVIDLLPGSNQKRSLSQALMEWKPLIRIYESRLWRRSLLFTLRTGISFEREYEVIAEAAKLEGNEILLDLACGPGIYSRPFARRLSRGCVVGLDLSVPMLDYASSRARAEGLENLVLIHGNALDLPFPDNEFDAANCCGAIHLFPDLPHAFGEISRVLGPGGRFTAAAFRRPVGRLAKNIASFYYRKFGLNSFLPDELESLFKQAGLHDVKCHHAKGIWLIMSAVKPE